MTIRLIDTHAHIAYGDYTAAEVPELLDRARQAGVTRIITVGAGQGVTGNEQARELAERFPEMLAFTVGVHPHDVKEMKAGDAETLEQLLHHPQAVAVGEVGLDYYYEHSPRDLQREKLKEFINLARKHDLPLVIHDRGSGDECYALLKAEGNGTPKGVTHCFTGTEDLAKKYLDLGFYLSFTGIITFKKADEVREIVRFVPLDRLMVETDSPFLSPVPYRGKRNEPAYVLEVAKAIADIKGLSLEKVAEQTSANAMACFGLKI